MIVHSTFARGLLLIGAIALITGLGARPASAQMGAEPPVMQNSFFNVIWGSAVGAMLGASSTAISQGTGSNPATLRENAITGATVGGVLGLGIGIWLTFNGITFDENRSLLFADRRSDLGGSSPIAAQPFMQPIEIETAPGDSFRITGAKALILDIRF